AATVTFNGLTSSNMAPFIAPYTEGTFTVTPISGTWHEAHLFGHPVPDIFGSSPVASIKVSDNFTGLFQFTQVDLADAGAGGATYSIVGQLGGSTVFTISDGPLPSTFATIPNPHPAQTVDTLIITMTQNAATYNIDNIVVLEVPEPSAWALAAVAGALMVF